MKRSFYGIIMALLGITTSVNAQSLWDSTGTTIYYNSGKVGIGTANPLGHFGVYKTGTIGQGNFNNAYVYVTDATKTLGLDPNQIFASDELILSSQDQYIILQTNGVNRLRINSTGRVGIGNDAVDVTGTSLDQLVVGDGVGSRGVVVYHGVNNDGGFAFADTTGNLTGRILYDSSDDEVKLQHGGSDRLNIGWNQIDLLENTDISGNLSVNGTLQVKDSDDAQTVLAINRMKGDGDPEMWWKLATLPISTAATGEALLIEFIGGTTTIKTYQTIRFKNRNGFQSLFHEARGVRTDVAIRAYEQVDGSVDIYMWAQDVGWQGLTARMLGGGWSANELILYADAPSQTTVPTGTEVFNSATEVPEISSSFDGNIGIGTTTPGNKLEINGTTRTKEVIVEATGWPDYVFHPDYELLSLSEIEAYIKEKGHLPEVPSAKEAEEEGQHLGEIQQLLLKKIEELTLYSIKQEKENKAQDELIKELLERIEKLEKDR